MNPPIPGGGIIPGIPIWYPPVDYKIIGTGLIVFAGAVANRLQPSIQQFFGQPLGFFLTATLAIFMFQYGYPPAAFALLYMLLMIWAASKANEGFLNATNTVDWVTSSKKWFVERILKETPVAIQEKDVATYPISD